MTIEVHEELEIVEDPIEVTEEKESPLAGKSLDELIAMNDQAQKQISRQGNEIGELRNLTDEILRKQLESTTPKKQESEVDWDYNPREAAEELVNSKVSVIEEKLEKEAFQRSLSVFENKHPKYKQIAEEEAFREWVGKSGYRTGMYTKGNSGDLSAADELFTEWENAKPQTDPENEENQDNDRQDKLKAAKMERGGGQPSTKKIFRRSELRALRLRDKEAYDARADEFHLAYQEGRVR